MNRRTFMGTALTALAMGLGISGTRGMAAAATAEDKLPAPGGFRKTTLEEALRARRTIRSYADKDLPEETLSNLLWAAWGVNRPGTGKRTAPSAVNRQEIDVYVAKRDGLFLYDAKRHALVRKGGEDIRALTGTQSFVGTAAVNLVFVADMDKVAGGDREEKLFYAGTDTGYISQNVYLFCAAEGLASVVRASIDKPKLAKAMGLAADQTITLAQCVGYPA
ncbi:nitroreductase [Desulfovibrio sp. X2]|uniref:SagB/ThcOx family dehydrogenase n=1 Tax=Desulfovibrio sp. X2 TaxID=941449 RepID=UPI000358E0D2|nr:SagB/ThcOx family dehydrogenase [Desulfovibrio sp. X2]EPR39092.1 nitroreductase [Desulfovibrio sp. X2]